MSKEIKAKIKIKPFKILIKSYNRDFIVKLTKHLLELNENWRITFKSK
jgi:hypothetical protein